MLSQFKKFISAHKYILFVLAILSFTSVIVTATYAQLVFEEEAKKPLTKKKSTNPNADFFNSCKERYFDIASFSIMETYCICTTAEQYEYRKSRKGKFGGDFLGNSSSAPIYSNDLALEIEAPCFYILANDLAYKRCKRDKSYDKFVPKNVSKNRICNCIADRTEKYFEQAAKPLLSAIVKNNPNILEEQNIMEILMYNNDYGLQMRRDRRECYAKFANY